MASGTELLLSILQACVQLQGLPPERLDERRNQLVEVDELLDEIVEDSMDAEDYAAWLSSTDREGAVALGYEGCTTCSSSPVLQCAEGCICICHYEPGEPTVADDSLLMEGE